MYYVVALIFLIMLISQGWLLYAVIYLVMVFFLVLLLALIGGKISRTRSEANELKNCNSFKKLFKNLYYDEDIVLIFNGKSFSINETEYSWNDIQTINIIKYELKEDRTFRGVTCLDGTPDMRYNSYNDWKYTYMTNFQLEFNTNKTLRHEYIISKKINKSKLSNLVKQINDFLFIIQSVECIEDYRELVRLNDVFSNAEDGKHYLDITKHDKEKLYYELIKYRDKFTSEQNIKFQKLQDEIDLINSKLNSIIDHKVEYGEYCAKFINKFNKLKDKLLKQKLKLETPSKINELFNQLDT